MFYNSLTYNIIYLSSQAELCGLYRINILNIYKSTIIIYNMLYISYNMFMATKIKKSNC